MMVDHHLSKALVEIRLADTISDLEELTTKMESELRGLRDAMIAYQNVMEEIAKSMDEVKDAE